MTKKLKRLLKKVSILYISTILIVLFFNLIPLENAYAANVLTNPSFTGGTTGWTLTNMTYDSVNYQDSAGSVYAHAARKASVLGTAVHDSYTSIASEDTVNLSGYWRITIGGNGSATLYVDIENQSNPGTWTTIWNTTLQSSASSWTAINTDVSSNFGTGSYRIRLRAQLDGGAAAGAGIDVWFDNMNLDVTPPNITVGTTGTQKTTVNPSTSNFYIGGAFTFVRDSSSTSVTSITVSETGTISDANISGLILYYKQEATCSTSIPGDATQFNSTAGTFTSGSSTVTGSMTVGTSQVCMYVEADIGAASVDDTIEIQITNPSTQVTAALGTVSPTSAVAISGTTTVTAAGFLSIDIVDGSDVSVPSPSVQFTNAIFNWVTTQTTATLGVTTEQIKVSNFTATSEWTLSIAATDGASDIWDSGTNSYSYNGTQSEGRLLVDPSTLTITPGGTCSSTGISTQSSAYFVSGSVDSINLLIAGGTAETSCDWYITGIDLTQDIPAQQAIGSYSIGMTLTVI